MDKQNLKRLAVAAAVALLPQGAALAADTIRADRFTTATLPLDQEGENYSYIDSAGDKDWWKVSLTKGKTYILRGGSFRCGTAVAVFNSSGSKLASASCSGSYLGGLEFTPTYTGVHYVEYAANGRGTSYP